MKICIPSEGKNGLDEKPCTHFGSAEYYVIYDTDSKEHRVVENTDSRHGHGACRPLSILSDHSVQALLTCSIGVRALQMMNDAGLALFHLEGGTVREAIENFESGKLNRLSPEKTCSHHGYGAGAHSGHGPHNNAGHGCCGHDS